MWSVPERLDLTREQRRALEAWISARNAPQKVVFRSRIVLLAAGGLPNRRIAQQLKTSRPTVILWRNRFASGGPAALTQDNPGAGANLESPPRRSNRSSRRRCRAIR